MKKSLKIFNEVVESHQQLLFLIIILTVEFGMIFFIGLKHSFWGDEVHFVSTIRYFGKHFNLVSLANYNEVTTPFVYLLFALFGKIVNFNIIYLRLFSLIFSTATLMFILKFYSAVLSDKKAAFIFASLLLLNPYLWGLSFFIFTDIPTLFFIILFGWAVYSRNTWLLFLATALSLLSRQYSVFIVIAAWFYFSVSLYRGEKSQINNLSALILGSVPLLILMFIWGGIAPPAGIKKWIIPDGQFYRFSYITTYITFIAIYLIPVVWIMRHQLFKYRTILAISFPFSIIYFLFPVRASFVTTMQTNYNTVGLLHRLIKNILQIPVLETIVFYGFFWLGIVLLINIILADIYRLKEGFWDFGHFLTLTVISYLVIMPFSYQVWEKYLISVLPFILLRLVLLKYYENKFFQ